MLMNQAVSRFSGIDELPLAVDPETMLGTKRRAGRVAVSKQAIHSGDVLLVAIGPAARKTSSAITQPVVLR